MSMTRLPTAAVLLLLRQSGIKISAATLRSWRARGHIGPGPGYDVIEILRYIERKTVAA